MRIVRITLGLLLSLAGLVATAAGAFAAFWLVGPDNTISTPSRELASRGLAVVTAPALLDRHGPTLHVSASGAKPLFIGVAQDLDVRDYLAGAAHTRLIRFDPPATFATQELRGAATKLTPPGELDWWVAQSAPGSQSLSWPIQDGLYDVVVMNADGTPAVGGEVTFGIQVHRLFGICLLVLGAGVLLLAFGLTLMLRRRRVVEQLTDTTEIPVIKTSQLPVLDPAAPLAAEEQLSPAHRVSPHTPEHVAPVAPERVSRFAPEEQLAPAYRVSPFAPERVSPFAPDRTSPFAPERLTAATPVTEEDPASDHVAADSTQPAAPAAVRSAEIRPAAVPAAPMFMSAAAVARAKSPVLIGATARSDQPTHPQYDESTHPQYDESTGPQYDDQPALPSDAQAADEASTTETETVPLAASPEFVRSDEAVRRTAALLASGALLLTTTSCSMVPPKNTLTTEDSRPAVTLADAQTVVQRYNQLNNQANRTRDAKLAATIEGNPTLAQTQAGFLIGRKLDPAGKEISKPFSYTNLEIGAPQFTAYPMRFVVSSGISNAPGHRQLGVWQRENAGSPWLLTHSVYTPKDVELPPVADLRTPRADDLAKLQARPEAVAKDLAAYLTAGKSASQAEQFALSPSLTQLLDLRTKSRAADSAQPYIAGVTDTFATSGDPLTFVTASGDALVFLSLTEQYLQRVEPGSNAYWTSGEATAFSSMVKYTRTIHQNYLHQVALVVPANSSDGVQVLSIEPQLVGAGGA
ncbi:hypothetical protein [Kribbella sp. NPDC048915]|uniref:hypothetical protein n=1 Tax=Kribbella sp. NPDC048915 TaxID=3155148 RepID=UPI0033F91468